MNNLWKNMGFVVDLISFILFVAVLLGSIFIESIRDNKVKYAEFSQGELKQDLSLIHI